MWGHLRVCVYTRACAMKWCVYVSGSRDGRRARPGRAVVFNASRTYVCQCCSSLLSPCPCRRRRRRPFIIIIIILSLYNNSNLISSTRSSLQ